MRQWRALPASRSVVSLQQYQELFAKPEIRAAFLASVLGRLPIGMSGLAILLLTQSASGSFAYAGAAVASYIAGLASIAPLLGRIIDRSGPARTLLVCGFLYPSALLALCAAVLRTFPMLAILGLAFAAGASYPPITVCMRTFFHQRLGEERLLATAYSLESVLIESIFVLGPMLVAFFVASASPAAAVVSAALCALAGALLFARSPALAHWRIEKLRRGTVLGPLAEPGFPALLAVVLFYSVAFGLVEIGVTAYASEIGHPALAGVLLAMMSIGSACGGLAYGSRHWHMRLSLQFALALLLIGAGVGALALVANPWLFAFMSTLAGVVMAPALTIQSMLVARISSPGSATEAFTWSSAALLTGVGGGMAFGGTLLERAPAAAVLAWAGVAAVLGAAAALAWLRRD